MANLSELLSELKAIRDSIIKLSKDKRYSAQGQNKFLRAKEIKNIFEQISADLCKKGIDAVELQITKAISSKFLCNFEEIESLVNPHHSETITTMATFDLKVALTLLPVVDCDETQINQLIDGIEYYSSTLRNEDQPLLINFVLKTRLSSSAKTKINKSYVSVADLIKDIKNVLIPIKSYTAILDRMLRCRQGNKTIEVFGSEIEKMSNDLSTAQANGDESAYNLLKPINEKMAIKRFADGLNNARTSIIVTSRSVSTVRQAITIALEQEDSVVKPPINNYVNYVSNQRFEKINKNYHQQYNKSRNNNATSQQGRGRAYYNSNRFQGQRNTRFTSPHNKRRNVHFLVDSAEQSNDENESERQSIRQNEHHSDDFFRSE